MELSSNKVQRCYNCRRPILLYGNRDPATGWVGWCKICSWHWRNPTASKLEKLRLASRLPVPNDVSNNIISFFVSNNELRKFKRDACFKSWFRTLLLEHNYWKCFVIHCDVVEKAHHWNIDKAKIDEDWLEEQVFNNPLWVLFFAPAPIAYPLRGRPFKILASMLGRPPLGMGEKYAETHKFLCA